MKVLVITAFLLFTSSALQAGGCSEGPHADAPTELGKLGFFIGSWDLESEGITQDGSYITTRARSDVCYTLDGMALLDEFRALNDGGEVIFRGTSFRTFDPRRKTFAITWMMANQSGITDITAHWEGEVLKMEGKGYDGYGEFLERAEYYDITGDGYRFRMDRSYDGGENWIREFNRIRATRIE